MENNQKIEELTKTLIGLVVGGSMGILFGAIYGFANPDMFSKASGELQPGIMSNQSLSILIWILPSLAAGLISGVICIREFSDNYLGFFNAIFSIIFGGMIGGFVAWVVLLCAEVVMWSTLPDSISWQAVLLGVKTGGSVGLLSWLGLEFD